eukprot:3940022-Rhodomonas_salina.2
MLFPCHALGIFVPLASNPGIVLPGLSCANCCAHSNRLCPIPPSTGKPHALHCTCTSTAPGVSAPMTPLAWGMLRLHLRASLPPFQRPPPPPGPAPPPAPAPGLPPQAPFAPVPAPGELQ